MPSLTVVTTDGSVRQIEFENGGAIPAAEVKEISQIVIPEAVGSGDDPDISRESLGADEIVTFPNGVAVAFEGFNDIPLIDQPSFVREVIDPNSENQSFVVRVVWKTGGREEITISEDTVWSQKMQLEIAQIERESAKVVDAELGSDRLFVYGEITLTLDGFYDLDPKDRPKVVDWIPVFDLSSVIDVTEMVMFDADLSVERLDQDEEGLDDRDLFELDQRRIIDPPDYTTDLRKLYFSTGNAESEEWLGAAVGEGDDASPHFFIGVFNALTGANNNEVINGVTVFYDIVRVTTNNGDVIQQTYRSDSVTFTDRQTAAIPVPVTVHQDHLVESNETFELRLTGLSTTNEVDKNVTASYTLGAPNGTSNPIGTVVGTYTIIDDDSAKVSIENTFASESEGTIVLVLRMDNPVDEAVTVTYVVRDLTTEPNDQGGNNGTVVFSASVNLNFATPGNGGDPNLAYQVTREIRIPIDRDNIVEGVENFVVELTGVTTLSGRAVTLGSSIANLEILDSNRAMVIIDDVIVAEDGTATVTLHLVDATTGLPTVAVDGGFTVNVLGSVGTAGSADFNGVGQIATFAGTAGETQTITFPLTDDAIVEATESFTVSLNDLIMAGPAPATSVNITDTATVTITDNDSAVVTLTGPGAVNEEAGTITYTVTVNNAVEGGFFVDLAFTDGSAAGGAVDYNSTTQTLHFSGTAGETITVVVPLHNEATVEANETFTATLQNLVVDNGGNVSVSGVSGSIVQTITNTDTTAVTIQDVVVNENDGTATITLALGNGVQGGFSVDVGFTHVTTTAADFASATQTVNFAGLTGETQTITVLLNNDQIIELANETATISLSNLTGLGAGINPAAIVITDTATLTILDDDVAAVTIADITVAENGTATVTLTLNRAVAGGFTVDVVGNNGTAIGGGTDYTGTAPSATFVGTAGETQIVTFPLTDDNLIEAAERFVASMTNLTMTGVAPATSVNITDTAIVTITDADTDATAVLSVTANGVEGGTNIIFTVTLDKVNQSGAPITFVLADAASGTATSGSDYLTIPGGAVISVAQGATTGTYVLPVLNDALVEANSETVVGQISAPSNPSVSITTATASATITDDDTAIANLSVTSNGVEGGTNVVFTVTLDKVNATGSAITFDIASSGGTATSGADYTVFNGQISVADGASTGTVTVTVTNDANLETLIETVQATISNSSNLDVTIGTAVATATITDNETATANLSVSTQGVEGGADIVYTVTLDKVNTTGAAITFQLVDLGTGTATAGSDYGAVPSFITIANGASTGTATVSVTNDLFLEATTESIIAQIINPSDDRVSIGTGTATATITDNDTAIANLSVNANAGEVGYDMVFTVTLDKANDTGAAITFDLANAGTGTATSGTDYTAIPPGAQITIAAGATTGTYTLNVIDDLAVEGVETVAATISNPSNPDVTIGTGTVTGNIADGDVANNIAGPVDGVNPDDYLDGTVLDTVNPLVTLSNGSGGPIYATTQTYQTGSGGLGFNPSLFGTTNTFGVFRADFTNGALSVSIDAYSDDSNDDALIRAFDSAGNLLDSDGSGNLTTGQGITLTVSGTLAVPIAYVIVTAETFDAYNLDNLVFTTISSSPAITADLSITTQGDEIGATSILVTVTLDTANNTGGPLTFSLVDLGSGTATGGTDYGAVPGTITIANGATTGTATITVTDDALLEANLETINLQIQNPSATNVIIGTSTATATITDNDTATADLSVTQQGAEGGTDIVFTVTLTKANNTDQAITFDLVPSGSPTATSNLDHTAIPAGAQIVIAVGANTGTFTVHVADDSLLEANTETVVATISNSSNADVTIGTGTATATITDNDTATANLSVTQQGVEGGTNVVYTVTLDKVNHTGSAITFNIGSTGGTATSGLDYTAFAGQISVADGASTGIFTVFVTNDTALETLVETLEATITNSSNADVTIGTASAIATITDNETAIANFSVAPASTPEDGAGNLVYTVTLDKVNNTGSAITFDVAALSSSTAGGADFTGLVGTITVANGASTGTMTIDPTADGVVEANETLVLQITNPSDSRVTIGTGSATGTIANDDAAAVTIADVIVNEEDGTISYVLTLNNTVEGGFDVDVNFAAGGAGTGDALAEGTDLETATQRVRFVGSSGETVTVIVPITNDLVVEGNETFTVSMSNLSAPVVNASAITISATATGTITNTDTTAVTIQDVVVNENDGTATITVALSNGVEGGFSVDVGFTGGTLSAADFANASQTVIFAGTAGETQTITVALTDDLLVEALSETTTISLSNLTGLGAGINPAAIVITDTATLTVLDNDAAAVTIGDIIIAEDGTATVTLTLSTAVDGGFTVNVLGSVGTAEAADFTGAGQIATFAGTAGETQTITFPLTDDAIVEANERFIVSMDTLTMTGPAPATSVNIADTATVTITDNDTAAVTVVDVTASEETGELVFTLVLNRAVEGGFLVDAVLADGTATGGPVPAPNTDFVNNTQTVRFAGVAGEIVTVRVPVHNDALLEAAETFTLSLNNLQVADPGSAVAVATRIDITDTAVGTITNDDTVVARVRANPADSLVGESGSAGQSAKFIVELSEMNQSGAAIRINYTTIFTPAYGIATNGVDFAALSGFVYIANNAQSAEITITAINDGLFDSVAQETVIVTLKDSPSVSVVIDVDHNIAGIGILDNAPVIIDLDGDGFHFADRPIDFDIDDDGVTESMAWAGPRDGILVYDANGNNNVDGRGEIVFTEHATNATTDLEAIREAFDSDGDGLLTAGDDDWSLFKIWQDANTNGLVDAGELNSLGDLGVVSIGLISDGNERGMGAGVFLFGESDLVFDDGRTVTVGDAVLRSMESLTNEEISSILSGSDQIDFANLDIGVGVDSGGGSSDAASLTISVEPPVEAAEPPAPAAAPSNVVAGEASADYNHAFPDPIETPAAV